MPMSCGRRRRPSVSSAVLIRGDLSDVAVLVEARIPAGPTGARRDQSLSLGFGVKWQAKSESINLSAILVVYGRVHDEPSNEEPV